jgi:hypothetical protein
MLETNLALGNIDHTFVSELEEGMWLIVFYLFLFLHFSPCVCAWRFFVCLWRSEGQRDLLTIIACTSSSFTSCQGNF